MEDQYNNFLNGVDIPVSASMKYISPQEITSDSFITPEDVAIIPNENISSSFFPSENLVEFYAYDTQKNIISRNYNFKDWGVSNNTLNTSVPTTYTNDQGEEVFQSATGSIPTDNITLNPPVDLFNLGFDTGEVYALYNFINYELSSSIDNTYYLSEISGDRTEVRLRSNTISNGDIRSSYKLFRQQFNSQTYFDEFYLGLFDNRYEICTNILLEEDEKGASILLKLYNELDSSISTESQVYIATKVGETVSYKVEFQDDLSSFIDNANYIKGPNINIPLQDLVNNSTTLLSKNDLLKTPSSGSRDSVLNILNKTGVTITPNYSYNTFNQFVNFSSAKERLNNFVEKVSTIQAHQADIVYLENATGSNSTVVPLSSSLADLTDMITVIVENFDGYENYLYYNSSSFAYPKTGSSYPYSLLSTTSTEVLKWVGNDVEGSQYYGGYTLSASLYDEDNQNWLYYTIPSFITENSNNDDYVTFSNMVGQSFDEVWIYTKALSERYNTTNDPDKGLPLDLAADAIKGLGFETFGNNYDNQDNFIGLSGEDDGIYVPPTGSELITKYIAINNGQIINYWHTGYSWEDYVEQYVEAGFPYAIDKVSKEIYKRLYHNMAYLTKKKGSISGLRQLINIWGIPNTILRINEFGGKNRDNTDDYDLWYNRYNYTYTPVAANNFMASSSVKVPWMPLSRNYIADSEYIAPDGIALRFKAPKGPPSSSYGGSFYSQSIAVKKSNGVNDNTMDWGISLFYEDQPTGSYSGSTNSDYYNYGKLRFYISASVADGGVQTSSDIYFPFFDGGWWSILLQRDQHVEYTDNTVPTNYTLFVANKQDNGWDGNSIGFRKSVTLSSKFSLSMNKSWNDFGVTNVDGVYVGGYVSGSNIGSYISNETGKIFSGSFQEFRYYSHDIPETVFNDFVMNPESIEGNNITGSESSFDIVNFRAPLGNELEHIFSGSSTTFVNQISSSHPAVRPVADTLFTSSFINPSNNSITSSYDFIGYDNSKDVIYSKTNTEVYFLDQPAIGIRNRVSNKIQVEDGNDYGKVLSKYRSIDQNYLISQSYTEDITSLEVGFSPQDEVNDDIIATFGYGAISSIIADPRNFYDSQEVYYPKLRQVAKDYFKKYTEGNVWDYLRLIKYFDNSLFKAIKSYVPARTSVTTGVIIKQNMLERNRVPSVIVNPNTIIAYTPETGSIVGGQSNQTGMNSAISYRNIEITGSINIGRLSGGTGGVVEPYNILSNQTSQFFYTRTLPNVLDENKTNIFDSNNLLIPGALILNGSISLAQGFEQPQLAFKRGLNLTSPLRTRFNFLLNSIPTYSDPTVRIIMTISSSIRGGLGEETLPVGDPFGTPSIDYNSNEYKFTPEETISIFLSTNTGTSTISSPLQISLLSPESFDFTTPFSSSLHNQYTSQSYIVRNNTVLGSNYTLQDTQDEFYNGEYSGSTIIATTQSLLDNPYAPSQTTNTSYNISVTSSAGISIPITDPSNQITSIMSNDGYPKFDFDLEVFATSDPDTIKSQFDDWQDNNLGQVGRGALFFLSEKTNPNKNLIYLVGVILPGSMNNQLMGITSRGPAGLLGWTPGSVNGVSRVGPVTQPSTQTPFPPREISGINALDGSTFPQYLPNDIGPYFSLDIENIIDPTSYAWPIALTVLNDNAFGSTPSWHLFSNFLGNSPSIEKTLASTGTHTTTLDYDKSLVKYWINDPIESGAKPLKFNQSLWQGTPTLAFRNPFFTTIINPDPTTGQIRISPLDTMISRSNSAMTLAANVPTRSSASLTVFGTTWTGSSGDSGTWSPHQMIFNNENEDAFGNIINNQTTLVNNPDFHFDIRVDAGQGGYQGQTTTEDIYGYSGSKFIQSLNPSPQVQSYGPIGSSNTGYVYNLATSRNLSGSYGPSTNAQWYVPQGVNGNQYIPFVFQLPNETTFYNSPFNPLINNATSSIDNTFLQIIEYANGPVPSNFDLIVNRTAEKAQIPDSFYTQKSSILPRYVGSTLQSANYNISTPPNSTITYLNNITGSVDGSPEISGSSNWVGDALFQQMPSTNVSLGTVAKHPKYFAHFKSSKSNWELWGTYTFRIDQLIECPVDSILGDKAPITPIVIDIDGSNGHLIDVGSNFEPTRKSQISYDIGNVLYKNQGITADKNTEINYTSLKVGENKIYQGGLEYQTITSNQPSQTSFAQTMSFNSSSWAHGRNGHANFPPQNISTGNIDLTTTTWIGNPIGANYFASASTDSAGGYIRLLGGAYNITASSTVTNPISSTAPGQYIAGPGLGVLHSMNKRVQLKKRASSLQLVTPPFDDIQIGVPQGISMNKFQAGGDSNYFGWNISQSAETRPQNYQINNYEDFEQPFTIEVDDEIRVTFNVNDEATKPQIFEERSFVVTKVGYRGQFGDETDSEFDYWRNVQLTSISTINSASLYDKIYVSPDPTLAGIPNGKIYNFTIRRRVNADDRVIIYQTPPRGTEGIRTLTPTGYLIPGDFSSIQKQNVLTLINQLKAKNTNIANDNSNSNMQS